MQGVFSHETALAIYELSDVQSEKLHLTVPRGFRRHSGVPSILKLHYGDVKPSEFEDRHGFRVTKPYRTIIDIIRAMRISPEFIQNAVRVSLDKGYLTVAQYRDLKRNPVIGNRLKKIMGDIS